MQQFLFTNTPLKFLIQYLWRDEAFSYILAKKNILEILFYTAKDFNPPLYYLVLHFWIQAFGRSEMILRLPSFFFYLGCIYVSYLIIRDILKTKRLLTFLFVLLASLTPILIYYAFEARMYSMLAFFSLLSSYAFLTKKNKLYLVATSLGLLSHYFMIFVVLSQILTNLIVKEKRKKTNIIFYSLMPFFIWMIYVVIQKNPSSYISWATNPEPANIVNLIGYILTGYERSLEYLKVINNKFIHLMIIYSFIFIFPIAAQFYLKKINNKNFTYLITVGFFIPLIIFIVSFFKPIFVPRYLIFSSPLFLILFEYSILQLKNKYKFIFILSAILLFLFYNYRQIQYRTKEEIGKTITILKGIASKNDLLYVTNELDFFTMEYYFDENRVYIYSKEYGDLAPYVGKALIPQNKLTNNLPRYPIKAFILGENGKYEIQSSF